MLTGPGSPEGSSKMGSRPSASIDSGEARGRQSGVVHPREEDEASDAFARRMVLPNEEDLSSYELGRRMGMPGREEFPERRGGKCQDLMRHYPIGGSAKA